MPKTKRYPWPASALTDPELMNQLHQVSKATRKPITVLIREATDKLVAELRDRMDDPASLRGVA
jgi:hypothetical protein